MVSCLLPIPNGFQLMLSGARTSIHMGGFSRDFSRGYGLGSESPLRVDWARLLLAMSFELCRCWDLSTLFRATTPACDIHIHVLKNVRNTAKPLRGCASSLSKIERLFLNVDIPVPRNSTNEIANWHEKPYRVSGSESTVIHSSKVPRQTYDTRRWSCLRPRLQAFLPNYDA